MSRDYPPEECLAFNPDFQIWLGKYHITFAALDLQVDAAICKFLKLEPKDAHLITAGQMFGPKARLLADLVGRSGVPERDKILAPLNWLRGHNKRDIIAHGYMWVDRDTVKFIQRISSNEASAKEHMFTLKEFGDHVVQFAKVGSDFQRALNMTGDEIDAFANAAMSLNRKSTTSPQSPASKKS